MLLILLAAFLLLILAVFIVLLIARRKNTSLNVNDIYKPYTEMSEEELNNYIDSARDDFARWAGETTPDTLAPGALEPGNAPLNPPINIPETVRLQLAALLLDPNTILDLFQIFITHGVYRGNAKALRSSIRLAKLELKTSVAGFRQIARLGLKASAKALTAATSKLAISLAVRGALLATGPVGLAVQAALFVMQATFGLMDQFGVGGYEELVSEQAYIGMRDYYDREHKAYCKENNIPYPQIYGPLDKLGEDEFTEKMSEEYAAVIEDENHPITIRLVSLITEFTERNGKSPSSDDIETILENDTEGFNDLWFRVAMERLAEKYNGKIIMQDGIPMNSYKSREDTEASFKWPLEDEKKDYYIEWDEESQISVIRPSIMRTFSEGLGFGCYYDKVRRLPHITESYCLENGLYHDGQGNQCRYKEGQDIAEMIFGKAFVRGLLQVFDPDMYKSCSDMEWCSDGKCKDDKDGYFCTKNELSYTRKGIKPRCPPGYTETTAGFCNRDCPPGYFRLPGDQICYNEAIKKNNNLLVHHPNGYACYGPPFNCGDNARGSRVEAATRCYDCWCAVKGGMRPSCVFDKKKYKYARGNCKEGYRYVAGKCYADSRPLETALPLLGEESIGECPNGTSKYLKGDALCYASCKEGYQDWPGGLCNAQNPKLQIKPKERKAPYGKTDFANSPAGLRIEAIKQNIKEGDVAGVAAGLGAFYLQTSPIVNGLGLQDFANMIPDV